MSKSIKFIDGTFSAEEAKQIILTLLQNKIDFHSRESMSLYERSNQAEDPHAKRREVLLKTKKEMIAYFEKSIDEGKVLTIQSDIHFTETK